MEENVILFHLTLEQAEQICKHYNKNINELEEYEICELLDKFIDENTLNVNIVRLRKTLAEIGLPDYLETKRGLGYCV